MSGANDYPPFTYSPSLLTPTCKDCRRMFVVKVDSYSFGMGQISYGDPVPERCNECLLKAQEPPK